MRNKNVGYLILGIAVVVAIMLFFFSNTARSLDETCPLVQEELFCPSSAALHNQTYFSFALVVLLIVIGLFFVLSPEKERIILKKIKEKAKSYDLNGLNKEEKQVFEMIRRESAMFQADLIDKLGFGKAKMSRILDRLEGKGFVERKRRGMNNLVVLK